MTGQQVFESEHNYFAGSVAGSTTVNYDIGPLPEGVKSIEAVIHVGATVTPDANSLIKVQTGNKADHSDLADVAALTTAIVAGMASLFVRLELVRPLHQYCRLSIIRGGGSDSISIDSVDLITHGSRKLPDSLPATTYSRAAAIDAGP